MVNKPSRKKFKKEYAFKLLGIAENDFYVGEFLTTAPKCRPEVILFQAQQAVEKSIKAVLVFREQQVPLTHSLEDLIAELPAEEAKFFPENSTLLTQFATVMRYTEGDEVFTAEDLSAALKLSQLFLDWAKKVILS